MTRPGFGNPHQKNTLTLQDTASHIRPGQVELKSFEPQPVFMMKRPRAFWGKRVSSRFSSQVEKCLSIWR